MNENYAKRKNQNENSKQEFRDLNAIRNLGIEKKPSGKQILNKLKESLKRNSLNFSYDGANITEITGEDLKNTRNITINKASNMTTADENNEMTIIPDLRDSIEKSHLNKIEGEYEKTIIFQNKKHTDVNNLSNKKKRGCIQFICKCFTVK